jgi:Zn-dependent peptidase ImmA (M78 family)
MTGITGSLSPSAYAQELRHELGLGWGRVEPSEICKRLGIRYWEDDLGESGSEADALLRGRSGRLAVVVNEHIRYASRRRFTGAHELGHARIPWHQRSEFWCTAIEVETYHPNRTIEREANEFGAELLLPERVVRQRLRQRAPAVSLIRELSEEYGTSLTATACKVVQVAEHDACAVALTGNDGVRWVIASHALRQQVTIRLGKGGAHPDSMAADILSGHTVTEGPHRVAPLAWLSGWRLASLPYLLEEVIPFSDLGVVLSFLSLPDVDED